jgi:hypothetical protein
MQKAQPFKHRFHVIISMGLVAVSLATQARAQTGPSGDGPAAAETDTVSLTIDFGDGAQKRFPKIAWPAKRKGTVADVLMVAEQHARGIQITARGKQDTRFLEAIDGLHNEGAGGRNWMFLVNGKLAQASFATTNVESGTDILWEFRTFQ